MYAKQGKKKVCVLIGIFMIFVVGFILKQNQNSEIIFSSEKWIASKDTERYCMFADFENNYELIGMNKEEIQSLLGEYSIRKEADFSDANMVDFHWGYIIREDAWEGMEVLLIGFKDDVVIKYEKVFLSEL